MLFDDTRQVAPDMAERSEALGEMRARRAHIERVKEMARAAARDF